MLRSGRPGFRRFGCWEQTWDRLSGHVEEASHMPQLEGPTTNKIYNYVPGGFGEKKAEKKRKEDWQQLLAQVPIFKKKKIDIQQ